jgi:predicted transcriptional regulator
VSSRRRWLKLAAVALGLLVVVVGVGAWRLLRVEEVPDELPPMQRDPADLRLGSLTDQPELKLGERRGKTTFLVVIGPNSGDNKEGQALNRALNRWIFPDTTEGFIVADAEGAGMFSGAVEDFVRFFEKESRFPIYVDFEGATMDTFQLAKGHHGFIVMGPEGDVLLRKSGGMERAELEQLRTTLGASEPPPPPPAPEFVVGDLSAARCTPRPCAIIFLGEDVARTEVPGVEDGFDGEREEGFALIDKPHIRLAATAMKMDLQGAPGVVVGRTSGLHELPKMGWEAVTEASQARAAFGLADGDSAFFVVDAQGRLAFSAIGLVPMYQWGAAADLLGAEVMPEEDD